MILLRSTTKVKAGIDHVHKYINDLNNLYNDFIALNKNSDLKVVKIENGIEFKGKSNGLLYTIIKNTPENTNEFSAIAIPESQHLKRFGNAHIVSKLSSVNSVTIIKTSIITEKTPGLLWRVIIKIIVYILMLQSKEYEKEYINRIEKNA